MNFEKCCINKLPRKILYKYKNWNIFIKYFYKKKHFFKGVKQQHVSLCNDKKKDTDSKLVFFFSDKKLFVLMIQKKYRCFAHRCLYQKSDKL